MRICDISVVCLKDATPETRGPDIVKLGYSSAI